ncbi:hypothetical protein LWC34_04325 [Kibdelosporangium philippinense]|uniref:Uncharacterized protein n=1 Tax=Kibdelosporangium philippinense TaxID=211113 RepID=A0ABS8Z290_9PSEU|nr:hypothetical protein [Kibdelosporangium philippinense]MCE7002054.1 hypothetical protein [Kibdelosporangium philippinense]
MAVVSDGSAFTDQDIPVEPLLRGYAALIHESSGLPTLVRPLGVGAPQHLQATLGALSKTVGAVLLPHVTPDRAHAVRRAVSDMPIVTEHDTTAIALTAALMTTLTRGGHPLTSSRVVIAGANTMPLLSPLLVTAGIGDITTWNRADAVAFPLHRVAAGAHAVIDLLGGLATEFDALVEPVVLTRRDPRIPLLALPGLLRALTKAPNTRLDVEVYHACALALVMATPPDERLPLGPDRALTRRVADAATQALHQPAQ